MIMKRMIFAALTALIISAGCEYHPFYDGQDFCIYNGACGLLKSDGGHAYVPVKGERAFVLDIYGGKGKSHSITVADPEVLGYSYVRSDVKTTIGDSEVICASITIIPKKVGETSINVTDDDTGESISISITICEAYKAFEVCESGSVFDKGSVFAFRYPYEDNVISIGAGSVTSNDIDYIADGTYTFFEKDQHLFFEIVYPASESGRPAAEGELTKKTYLIFPVNGYYYGAYSVMQMLNLSDYELLTRSSDEVEQTYHVRFKFMEHDPDIPVTDSLDGEAFSAYSARIISKM